MALLPPLSRHEQIAELAVLVRLLGIEGVTIEHRRAAPLAQPRQIAQSGWREEGVILYFSPACATGHFGGFQAPYRQVESASEAWNKE